MWRCFQTLWNIDFQIVLLKILKNSSGKYKHLHELNCYYTIKLLNFLGHHNRNFTWLWLFAHSLQNKFKCKSYSRFFNHFHVFQRSPLQREYLTWCFAFNTPFITTKADKQWNSSDWSVCGFVGCMAFAEKGSCLGNFGLNLTFRIWDANKGEKKHSPCTKTS